MTTHTAESYSLACADAKEFITTLPSSSVDCVICDPPFGIEEDTFGKHYARDANTVVDGYKTAPSESAAYQAWIESWLHQIPRILKRDGTAYIVCAWNHVTDVELAVRSAPKPGLRVLNHIIWKYNFGVYTQKKFVTSHYHILRIGIVEKPTFYTRAYYTETDLTATGHKAQYADLEDVWCIPKEYAPGAKKNMNKLPDALVEKMIRYATKPGDTVADFFLGNFTTAIVGRRLGRRIVGCEINAAAYTEGVQTFLATAAPAPAAAVAEKASTKPSNAGKEFSEEEKAKVRARAAELLPMHKTKKAVIAILQEEFGRGHFSIVNVLKTQGTPPAP
jgi:site-specific DNA-methyltransferase (adenine-specific)